MSAIFNQDQRGCFTGSRGGYWARCCRPSNSLGSSHHAAIDSHVHLAPTTSLGLKMKREICPVKSWEKLIQGMTVEPWQSITERHVYFEKRREVLRINMKENESVPWGAEKDWVRWHKKDLNGLPQRGTYILKDGRRYWGLIWERRKEEVGLGTEQFLPHLSKIPRRQKYE